jgi:tRNA(Ile)-lysidine synthase
MPVVYWKRDSFHCEIRKYRNVIYLLDVSARASNLLPDANIYPLNKTQAVILNDDSIIQIAALCATDVMAFDAEKLSSKPLTIRFRQGGERFKQSASGPGKQLKHWFQEQGIPPWERNQIPLIYWGESLIQAGQQVLNHTICSRDKKNSLIIRWIRSDLGEIENNKR